jgi:hypothetical protein
LTDALLYFYRWLVAPSLKNDLKEKDVAL